jgi:hypothetical protein
VLSARIRAVRICCYLRFFERGDDREQVIGSLLVHFSDAELPAMASSFNDAAGQFELFVPDQELPAQFWSIP